MVTAFVMLFAAGLGAEDVGMRFIATGAYAKASNPAKNPTILVELNDNKQPVKKAPEQLAAPKYGTVKIDEQSWAVILDEPEGKPARLYIDTNADGDLRNDPEASWVAETQNGSTTYRGQAEIDLVGGNRGALQVFRGDPNSPRLPFDANDPRRARIKNRLRCRQDYGFEITVKLDGQEFTSYVCGKPTVDSTLWIDRDGNQRRSPMYEFISVGKPFNFTGTSYVLALNGKAFALDRADAPLPLMPLSPDLSIGKKAPAFIMEAMDGAKIDVPKTFAGKLVMLDFWATWCGPCIAELPNIQKAYEAWHEQGFEVLGISLDDNDMTDEVEAFAKGKGMPWPQIYEGKHWDTTLGRLYDVTAIPFVLLIDGDSGEIVGTPKELNGPDLSDFVGKALMEKGTASK